MSKLEKARNFRFLLGLCFILFVVTVILGVVLVFGLLPGA
jgi:hypothetical protein